MVSDTLTNLFHSNFPHSSLSEVSFFIDFPILIIPIFVRFKKQKNMILGVSYTEWVGYLASLVLIISFLMKNVSTLRIINSMGAILFIFYGVMLAISWPIIITNGFILLANIYYLSRNRNNF